MKIYYEFKKENKGFKDKLEKYAVKLAKNSVKKSCPGFIYEPKVPISLLSSKND